MNTNAEHPRHEHQWPDLSPFDTGLRCTCPRCGQGRLYAGVLNPAPRCMSCGLDYSFIESGDGPAVFVILILGFVILGLAMAVQSALAPPVWVHIIVWGPLIIGSSIWALRVTKSIMIAMQYKTSAREGALDGKHVDMPE